MDSDDSDWERSSAEEERRQRRKAAAAAATGGGSAAAAAASSSSSSSARVPTSRLLAGVELQQRTAIPGHAIPQMVDIKTLLDDCSHLRQNIDGSPACDALAASLRAGSARRAPPSSSMVKQEPGTEGSAAAAASSSSSSSKIALTTPERLQEALRAVHEAKVTQLQQNWLKDELQEAINRLPVPTFYDPSCNSTTGALTQEMLMRKLQRQQLHLPILTASMESLLYQEAGTFTNIEDGSTVTFPPCANRQDCVGMQKAHCVTRQSRLVVFTMIMFEDEFRNLMTHGVAPRASRPCVGCARSAYTTALVQIRALLMCEHQEREIRVKKEFSDPNDTEMTDATASAAPAAAAAAAAKPDSVLPVQLDDGVFKQWYANLCDQKNGYKSVYMLLNNGNPKDPLLEPLCCPGRSLLYCEKSTKWRSSKTNEPRLVVNQSNIIWTCPSPPEPELGESLALFCGGASNV